MEPLLDRLLYRSSLCGEKAPIKLLCLLITLGFAVLLCSVPRTHGGDGVTTLAWENMKLAKAWPSPQSPRAWQIQQPASGTQSMFRQPWHVWQQNGRQFINSVQRVSSDQNGVMAGLEHGVIKHWNYDKGYGFIKPSDGSKKVYCHASALVDGSVEKGDQVIYGKVFEPDRGVWRCVDVSVARSHQRLDSDRKSGIVRSWDSQRGFGFIQPSGGGKNLFCHYKDLVDVDVQVGDHVTYDEQFNDRSGKYRCVEVSLTRDPMHA